MLAVITTLLLIYNLQMTEACEDVDRECVIKDQTREIRGTQVHRDCWQYRYRKDCGQESKNDCSKMDHDNCSYVEEECLSKRQLGDKELCSNYRRHFGCEKQTTYSEERIELLKNGERAEGADLACGLMCLDGNCDAVRKSSDDQNNEITQAAAMLNALKEARKGIVGSEVINIFRGEAKHCDRKITSYTDCCKIGGWGKMLGARCNPESKNLAKLRRARQCVDLGTFCYTKVPILGCIIKRKVFCCYDSILAKIINQGIKKQLGRGNGSPESPFCGGIDLNDLKDPRVDLRKLDYSDFYRDVLVPRITVADVKMSEDIATSAQGITNSEDGLKLEKLKEAER